MISIIVCSVDDKLFSQFSENVRHTINTPHEIIKVDNKNKSFSLCSAYNYGFSLAKHDIICFSHEDIIFETENWGNIVIDAFNDSTIGLIGNLGTTFLSLFPIGWVDSNELEGRVKEGILPGNPVRKHDRFGEENSLAEVVAVDGMLMFTKRGVLKEFRFSEELLTAFHGYDIDFSLQVREKYRICVLKDLLVLHLSGGAFNENYFETMKVVHGKWGNSLPVYVSNYSPEEIQALNLKSLEEFSKSPAYSVREAMLIAFRRGVLISWLRKLLKKFIGISS